MDITPPRHKRSDFELMAPVGSYESLHAAIDAGADAVYLGLGTLNMRARSSVNFTTDDLRVITDTCRRACVKVYLTLNTVLYDEDMDASAEILCKAKECGVSAVIASDIAAIQMARDFGLEVHISTQCNVSNFRALRFYAQWADTVVLARELNLDQVYAIHHQIEREDLRGPHGEQVKIEMFCHGALCMAVSGKCYMSLHQMDSSANRGSCTQICRRAYDLTDRDTGQQITVDGKYLMSPKDLKTIHFLNKMVDAGVRVFKIEGRARGPEYVREAVSCYDAALRAICDGTYDDSLIARWDERLGHIFNRGFWDGYYLGCRLGEWSSHYGSSATRKKVYAARATRYFPRLGVAEFKMEAGTLRLGDEVVITGPTTGALISTVSEIHGDDGSPVKAIDRGHDFAIAVPAKVRPGDRLYLWEQVDKDNPRHLRF